MVRPRAGRSSYGHITVKPPHPIRTAKLSTVELDQYYGGGPRGNLECRMATSRLVFCCPLDFRAAPRAGDRGPGWVAERSKALVSGTSLFGGTGSNPVPVILFSPAFIFCSGVYTRVAPAPRSPSELAQWKRVRLIT